MRSLIRSIGIVLAVLTFASVQNASAQITGAVEFTTSFPFTVGNTTVPAGNYTIRPDDDNPQILELRALEKWNGTLPQVTGGAIPFITLPK